MTELKDFIKATIFAITDAVTELQQEMASSAKVAPIQVEGGITTNPESTKGLRNTRKVYDVDFDVCVTVGTDNVKETNTGASIKCLYVARNGNAATKSENVSRVRFSIPVVYPAEITPPPHDEDPDSDPKICFALR